MKFVQRSFGGHHSGANRPRFNHGLKQNRKIKSFDPSRVVSMAVSHKSAPQNTEIFVPKNSIETLELGDQLKRNVMGRGYKQLTPIQDQVIPLMTTWRDVIGIANTGTGKTAAFLLPLIEKINKDRNQRVLVIAPTRELAVQIDQELRKFSMMMNIRSVVCIGGVGMGRQILELSRNPSFVIGTPGRLKDLENRRKLNFSIYNNVVLDEVDRMLDMGFVNDIKYIASKLPQTRQTAFFSATMTEEARKVAGQFLRNPVTISVKTADTIDNVEQKVVKANGKAKVEILHDLLIQAEFQKVLVFGRTKHGLDKLARELTGRGFNVDAIHGNRNQNQRQRSLEMFRSGKVKILLATDVASRGLDINNVTHVINYDLPESYEDYIHRIGRTGRADKKGIALTIVD